MRKVGTFGAMLVAACVAASCGGCGDDTTHAGPDGGAPAGDGGNAQTDGGGGNDGGGTQGDGAVESCLGSSLLGGLGKSKLLVGGTMQDATASSTPIDLRYIYISGNFADGAGPCTSCASGCTSKGQSCANNAGGCGWWGCWQYDKDPPGGYARAFVSTAKGAGQIPMFTYYTVLQSSGVKEGSPEVTQTSDATYMARYYADWRFLLKQIGKDVALLHIEPDFWGYAEQGGADPHSIPSAVASANATDCGGMENTLAGFGQCMIAMVRKYAPNAKVGLHASAWGTNMDVAMNTNPKFDVAGEAKKLATFLSAAGEKDADFVVVEASDRDAGYYQSIGQNRWWDDTNQKLPTFHQDLAWVKALTEALGKPAIYWQIPYGNMSQNQTANHWKDNRVDYFFAHMDEVAAAHAIGLAFGAGAGDQTTAESDGGNFIAKVKAYKAGAGQPLCP